MRKLHGVLPLLAALALSGWLLAQEPKKSADGDTSAKVRGTLPSHWKSLGLTDSQKQQVYKIRNSYTAKIDALRQQIRDLQDAEKDELEKLLTDAQKLRLRELKLGETTPKDPDKKPTDGDKKPADGDKKPADPEKKPADAKDPKKGG
jgi:hypothetical protein